LALIDLECTDPACGHVTENHYRPAADWQTTPACEKCGKPTERVFLPPRTTWSADPVILYRDPLTGDYRFPGATESLSTKQYEKLGMERIEVRGWAEARSVERRVNSHEFSRACRRAEAADRGQQLQTKEQRSELFRQMASFSNMGKDVAREAMARNNAKPGVRAHEPGIRIEVFSENRGNREVSRGADGRRRRD
jgi:hypothetical protein